MKKQQGLIIDLDKVKKLLKEKHIKKFSCGLINDAYNTMGADIETRLWDGKDLADGYVFSTTFGVPGIQDTESGIYYPAYRDMTQKDFEEIEAYRAKQHKELDNLLADMKKNTEG